MGPQRDPFFIEASPYGNPFWRGAYPEYTFANETKKPPASPDDRVFQAPSLTPGSRHEPRSVAATAPSCCRELDRQRGDLERSATSSRFDRHRQSAISLLASPEVRQAFDVTRADDEDPGALRPQQLRLVAADGLPARRGRRQSGPGQPRQQRDLGHPRRHLPPDEEQAAPSDRPRLAAPCSTT